MDGWHVNLNLNPNTPFLPKNQAKSTTYANNVVVVSNVLIISIFGTHFAAACDRTLLFCSELTIDPHYC